MSNFPFSLLILFSLLCGISLPAQDAEPGTAESGFESQSGRESISLFEFLHRQQDSLPFLRLDTDWGLLVRNKMKEEYQPGVLSFRQEDGSVANLDVKIRARGNIRKEVCYFPPIKIKAKKKQLKELGFTPDNDLKLVLPCKSGGNYEVYLLREALAYRLYEGIHPVHFKTKVIKMEGWEGEKQKQSFTALLVEDEDEFAARLNGKVLKRSNVRPVVLERDPYLKMCFFQYMISNTDWSVPNSHNLELIVVPGFNRIIAVPYDFDYAGFTGTYYAVPSPTLPINNVNQRLFLGSRVTEEEALSTARFFVSKKEEILRQCAAFGLLDEKEVASLERYLMKFFDLLENDKKISRTFANAD